MARIPFALASARGRSLPVTSQRLVNWFVQQEQRDAKAPTTLRPTPGLVRFAYLATGPVRGMHVMGSYLYVVGGTGVYRVDVSGASTFLGNISDGAAVAMEDNGTEVVIVVPETGQAWAVTSTTITQITDADFQGAKDVAYLNGYMIYIQPDTQRFYISQLNNASAIDALDYAEAEAAPDNLVACARVVRGLWLFGERSIEIWSDIGAADFPFAREAGGLIDVGCAARHSVAVRVSRAYWLGHDRVVYRSQGGEPERISTHAVEEAIAGYTTVSDARAHIYDQEGHTFYVLTFPTEGVTWVYDATTQAWHERESDGYGGRWRIAHGASYGGLNIGGDALDGRLYMISPTAYTEDGDTIIRQATGAPIHEEGKVLFHSQFEVEFETGVGLAEGQGSNPRTWLTWSDDGGRTWSSERWMSLGRRGVYNTRTVWRRLGHSRGRTYRIGLSDPVGTTLIAANVDASVGGV